MMLLGSVGVDPASATAAQAEEEGAAAQGVRASSARARRRGGGVAGLLPRRCRLLVGVASPRRRIAAYTWGCEIAHVSNAFAMAVVQRWGEMISINILALPFWLLRLLE